MQQKLNLAGRLLMAQIFLLAGGLLVLSASGAGTVSLDAWLLRRRVPATDVQHAREASA